MLGWVANIKSRVRHAHHGERSRTKTERCEQNAYTHAARGVAVRGGLYMHGCAWGALLFPCLSMSFHAAAHGSARTSSGL